MSDDDESEPTEVETTGLDVPDGHESQKGAFNDSSEDGTESEELADDE